MTELTDREALLLMKERNTKARLLVNQLVAENQRLKAELEAVR